MRLTRRAVWVLAALAAAGALYTGLGRLLAPLDSDPLVHSRMQTQATLRIVGAEVRSWVQAHDGRLPGDAEGLSVLGLRQPARDSWGRPLVYRVQAAGARYPFALYSLGPLGVDRNGAGDNISYWDLGEAGAPGAERRSNP